MEPDREHLEACKPYFPESEKADLYHAATCLKTGAAIIYGDKCLGRIGRSKLIRAPNTSEAIREILG